MAGNNLKKYRNCQIYKINVNSNWILIRQLAMDVHSRLRALKAKTSSAEVSHGLRYNLSNCRHSGLSGSHFHRARAAYLHVLQLSIWILLRLAPTVYLWWNSRNHLHTKYKRHSCEDQWVFVKFCNVRKSVTKEKKYENFRYGRIFRKW